MLSLHDLTAPADAVAALSLALLAAITFLGRADLVAKVLVRGRYEFCLIWALAAALRVSLAVHSQLWTAMLQVATATVMVLTAGTALIRVLRRG